MHNFINNFTIVSNPSLPHTKANMLSMRRLPIILNYWMALFLFFLSSFFFKGITYTLLTCALLKLLKWRLGSYAVYTSLFWVEKKNHLHGPNMIVKSHSHLSNNFTLLFLWVCFVILLNCTFLSISLFFCPLLLIVIPVLTVFLNFLPFYFFLFFFSIVWRSLSPLSVCCHFSLLSVQSIHPLLRGLSNGFPPSLDPVHKQTPPLFHNHIHFLWVFFIWGCMILPSQNTPPA